MKSLLMTFALLLSHLSMAQDNYHSFSNSACATNDSCLVNLTYDLVIKLLPLENRTGDITGERLSITSTLSDTLFPAAKLCYVGSATKVCQILETMAAYENSNYYGGGHSYIEHFTCSESHALLVKFSVKHDMTRNNEKLNFQIERCH
jgi:hypothetical protein